MMGPSSSHLMLVDPSYAQLIWNCWRGRTNYLEIQMRLKASYASPSAAQMNNWPLTSLKPYTVFDKGGFFSKHIILCPWSHQMLWLTNDYLGGGGGMTPWTSQLMPVVSSTSRVTLNSLGEIISRLSSTHSDYGFFYYPVVTKYLVE